MICETMKESIFKKMVPFIALMKNLEQILTSCRKGIYRMAFIGLGIIQAMILHAQDVPSRPLSIPIYHPIVLNPAFVGSKDYTNISLTSKISKTFDYQMLNLHQRLTNSEGRYTNLGFGAYAFQEQLGDSWNAGLAVSGAYHFALDDQHLHNLGVGVTGKGIFFIPKHGEESLYDTLGTKFQPNMDLGIYYYGPQGFAGLSATSLFPGDKDSITSLYASVDREYHLYGGYKFILSKKSGIVLEPSILVSVNDNTISEPHLHLIPYLKVYLQNFYVGTYLRDLDILGFFFQYQFPRFYTGLFIEFPRIGYFNDDNIIFELSLGINLGKEGESFLQYRHW